MRNVICSVLFLLFFSAFAAAQDTNEAIVKRTFAKIEASPAFKVNVRWVFSDGKGKPTNEVYSGVMYVKNRVAYMPHGGMVMVYKDNAIYVVNHSEEEVLITDNEEYNPFQLFYWNSFGRIESSNDVIEGVSELFSEDYPYTYYIMEIEKQATIKGILILSEWGGFIKCEFEKFVFDIGNECPECIIPKGYEVTDLRE